MKRKIIKQGHNTFTITLPSKWAKHHNLRPGTEIDVIEQGNSIIASLDSSEGKPNRAEIDISGLPNPLLWRFVSAVYRAGYNEFKINFEGIEDDKSRMDEFSYDITDWFYRGELPKDRVHRLSAIEAIQALVNRFVGVEIVEQKQNYVIVKQFGEITYKEFDNALKRIFMVLNSMSKEVLEGIEKKDRSTLKAIHMIDTNIDRFEDYCLRVLNVKGYADYKKTPAMYSTIFLLEMVGDEYKRVAKHALEDKPKYGPEMLKFFRDVNEQFSLYYDLFYHFDRNKAIKIFEREEQFYKRAKKMHHSISTDERELLHHLKKITRQTISLVELAIDLRSESVFRQQPIRAKS